MGVKLAKTIASQLGKETLDAIDVVMAIPETSATAAKVVAAELKKEFVDGFTKNRYVFRTFIMPNPRSRQTGVRRKLIAHDAEFQGRNVLLIDDSIVRGNTSLEIVQMARDAGAKSVIFASCSPPIAWPHIYGIDLAQKRDLIASNKSPQQVAKAIGADAVVYQSLPDLVDAIINSPNAGERKVDELEVGVFNGKYITPLSKGYLDHLEDLKDRRKEESQKQSSLTALVNGEGEIEDIRRVTKNGRDQRLVAQLNGVRSQDQDIALHNINDQEH